MLAFESPFSFSDNYKQQFKGWFIPPASTRYRFYQSCDDACDFKMSQTNMDIANVADVLNSDGSTGYRKYFSQENERTRISDWIQLS